MKKKIVLLGVLISLCISSYCYSQVSGQGQGAEVGVAQGSVSDIDWVAGELVVRTYDFNTADETTFVVARETKILKGTREISFSDILQSDQVTVTFSSSLAGLKALKIVVQE